MILELTYEEVTALNSAAERMLGAGRGGVAAPPEALAVLDERLPLQGDISVDTTEEQTRLMAGIDAVLDHLRERMDALILEQYVGADDAVNAYFDYANVLTARRRLLRIGHELHAVADVLNELEPDPADPTGPADDDAPGPDAGPDLSGGRDPSG